MSQKKRPSTPQRFFGFTNRDIALLSLLIIVLALGLIPGRWVLCKKGNDDLLCPESPAIATTGTPTSTTTETPPPTAIPSSTPTEETVPPPSNTPTAIATTTSTPTATPSPRPTEETPTLFPDTPTATATAILTPSSTLSPTPTATHIATATPTATTSPTSTATVAATATFTPIADTPTFTPTPSPSPLESNGPQELPLEGNVSGMLNSGQKQGYTFTTQDEPVTLTLLFRPSVAELEFDIYRQDGGEHVAKGTRPPFIDVDIGGLSWTGGEQNVSYFMDIVNYSAQTVEYCLVAKEVFEWICN